MENNEQHVLQKHLARFLIDDVFNLPDQHDLLDIRAPGVWMYQGRPLMEAEIVQLQAQAEKFLDSELWKILKNALRNDALTRSANLSKTESDLIAAKVELYLIKLIEDLLHGMIKPGG